MKLNEIEEYELKAEAFKIMTGYLAPGKDAAMIGGGVPYEERVAAWEKWIAVNGATARAFITALRVIDGDRYA